MQASEPQRPDGRESSFHQPVVPRRRGIAGYLSSVVAWASIAGVAIVILALEYVLGWRLFFSPGWANSRPYGLSYQVVLSVGIAAYSSLMLITAAYGAGAVVGAICALFRIGEERRLDLYVRWLWIAALIVFFLSIIIFWHWYVRIGPVPLDFGE